MLESGELLFFDTFGHEISEDVKLDLVQFSQPVIILEVRVIPQGSSVQAKISGGKRTGATNPSQFHLELFVNNLSKPNSATFEKLGVLDYRKNIEILFKPASEIPTDGLILKGVYSAVTVAVYGRLTPVAREAPVSSPPPPPPPQQSVSRAKAAHDHRPTESADPGFAGAPPRATHPLDYIQQQLEQQDAARKAATAVATILTASLQPAVRISPAAATLPSANRSDFSPGSESAPPKESSLDVVELIDSHTHSDRTSFYDSHSSGGSVAVKSKDVLDEHDIDYYCDRKESSRVSRDSLEKDRSDHSEQDKRDIVSSREGSREPREGRQERRNKSREKTHSKSKSKSRSGSREREYRDRKRSVSRERSPEWETDKRDRDRSHEREQEHGRDFARLLEREQIVELEKKRDRDHPRAQDKERDRDYGRDADRSKEHERDGERERDRRLHDWERSPERERDRRPERSPNRDRDRRPERSPDRERDRRAERSPDREHDRRVDRSPERERDRRAKRSPDRDHLRVREIEHTQGAERPPFPDWQRSPDRERVQSRAMDPPIEERVIIRDRPPDWERSPEGDRDYRREIAWGRDMGRGRGIIDRERMMERDRERPHDWGREEPPEHVWPPQQYGDVDRHRDPEMLWPPDGRDIRDPRGRSPRSPRSPPPTLPRPTSMSPPPPRPVSPPHSHSPRPRSPPHGPSQMSRSPPHGPSPRPRSPPRRPSPRPRTPPHSASQRPRTPPHGPSSRPRTPPHGPFPRSPPHSSFPRSPPHAPFPRTPPHGSFPRSPPHGPFPRSPPHGHSPRSRSPLRPRSRSPPGEIFMKDQKQWPLNVNRSDKEPGDMSEDGQGDSFPLSSPVHSLGDVQYLSDGETQDEERYEAISSDEELGLEDTDISQMTAGLDYYEEDSWNFALASFNPDQCDLAPLDTFGDPSLTKFEITAQKYEQLSSAEIGGMPDAAKQLLTIVTTYKNTDHYEKWVEALECVPNLLTEGLSYLLYTEDRTDVLNILLDWALEGVNFECAMKQPETIFKVRHLKMGMRLAGSLCSCDSIIALRLLNKDIQDKLLDLYMTEGMSISLKLELTRALDQTTRFKDGIDWFLGQHPDQPPFDTDSEGDDETVKAPRTLYQRMIEIILSKQSVRAVTALTTLLRKVHVYEVLCRLTQATEHVVENMPSAEDEMIKQELESTDGNTIDKAFVASSSTPLNMADVETLSMCLDEVTKILVIAPHVLVQSKSSLPLKSVFEMWKSTSDPYPNLYHMFHACRLVECLFILVSSPATASHPIIFSSLRDLLKQLTSCQSGLLFLSSRPETTSGIFRSLTHEHDFGRDDNSEDSPNYQLGLELIYSLLILQSIDQLLAYHEKPTEEKDVDDADALSVLHILYTMTFTAVGTDAMVAVFSMDDNLKVLLPFVEKSGIEKKDARLKKSACVCYTTELLMLIIRRSDNIKVLETFAPRLRALNDKEVNSTFMEVHDWMAPTEKLTTYSYEALPGIIEQLNHYKDDIVKLPRGLITTLRIIKALVISPPILYPDDTKEELKYKYALLELYGASCFTIFINIITKISEMMLYPWQKGTPLPNHQLLIYLEILKPSVAIIKGIISELISARGSAFKDLTSLPAIFGLHTVLCTMPLSSMLIDDIQKVQHDLVDIIAAFTQPIILQTESEEALSKSLWTLAIKELLKYTLKAPYTYLSGLMLLSELLPLPLPLYVKEKLTDEEVTTALNSRKLWSAHLHSLGPTLATSIKTLAGSMCQPLQHVLRRVCWQLADLGSPTANVIARCLLDMILESIQTHDLNKPEETQQAAVVAGVHPINHVFDLLTHLITQSSIKVAVLQFLRAGGKDEEHYGDLIGKLLEQISAFNNEPYHICLQVNIASFLQALCDVEVKLEVGSEPEKMAGALLDKDTLFQIVKALIEHIGHPEHALPSILACLHTALLFSEHNLGFCLIKRALDQCGSCLYNLLNRLNTSRIKSSPEWLSTLSVTLKLLLSLCTIHPLDTSAPDLMLEARTYKLTPTDLRELMRWSKDSNNHLINDFCKWAKDSCKDKDFLLDLLNVVKLLRDMTPQSVPAIIEPVLPPAESLNALFARRTVYIVMDPGEDQLNPAYWLPNPALEDTDPASQPSSSLVECDFVQLISQYCQDFDLVEELKKASSVTSEVSVVKPKLRLKRHKRDTINIYRGRGARKPFVAPMRGRGILSRGMMSNNNRHDPFRSRMPNTSRPPSMHVDDFVKLEERNQGSASQGPPSRHMDQPEMIHGRGRGGFEQRGRGFPTRGRGFFPPSGNYGRHGGPGGRGLSGPPPGYPGRQFVARGGGFNRGGHDDRPPSGDRRLNRDSPYPPRGGRGGYWMGPRGKDDSRFPSPGPAPGFRGHHDPGRHERSSTN